MTDRRFNKLPRFFFHLSSSCTLLSRGLFWIGWWHPMGRWNINSCRSKQSRLQLFRGFSILKCCMSFRHICQTLSPPVFVKRMRNYEFITRTFARIRQWWQESSRKWDLKFVLVWQDDRWVSPGTSVDSMDTSVCEWETHVEQWGWGEGDPKQDFKYFCCKWKIVFPSFIHLFLSGFIMVRCIFLALSDVHLS